MQSWRRGLGGKIESLGRVREPWRSLGRERDTGNKIVGFGMWILKRHNVDLILRQGDSTEKVRPVKMIIILGSISRTDIEDVKSGVIKDMQRINRRREKDVPNSNRSSMYRGHIVMNTRMRFKGHRFM